MNISKSSEHEDFEWAVKLQRAGLELAGLWPKVEHKRGKLLTDLLILVEFLIVVFVCTIPSFHAMLKNLNDIQAVVDNLQFTAPLCMTLLKLVVLTYKKNSLIPVINMIADDWSKPKPISERIVMIQRGRIARRISACTNTLMTICFLMITTLPGFGITFRYISKSTDSDRIMPIQSYYMFDVHKSPNYEIMFIIQSIGLALAGICTSASDNLLGLLILHFSGQMENLRARFKRMIDAKEFDKALASNVEDHIRIIRSVDIIESTFTVLLLGLLLYFSIFFCVYATLLVTIYNQATQLSKLRVVYLFIVLLTVFLHICLCFFVGELLVNHSERIYDTICECEWEKLGTKRARNMIMLMIRAKKPLYITAGKVIPMTMPAMCTLLKVSASYTSFLIARLE